MFKRPKPSSIDPRRFTPWKKTLTLESVELVAQLEQPKAAHMCGLPMQRFAVYIGLTINQYWKRAAAARVIERFKEAKNMLKSNETCLSHMALVSAKITDANAEIVLGGIKNKKRRDVEALMSRVTRDGRLLDQEEEVELRVRLKASALELLDQAKAVLAHGGRTPGLDEVLIAALGDLLDKRDPGAKPSGLLRGRRRPLPQRSNRKLRVEEISLRTLLSTVQPQSRVAIQRASLPRSRASTSTSLPQSGAVNQ